MDCFSSTRSKAPFVQLKQFPIRQFITGGMLKNVRIHWFDEEHTDTVSGSQFSAAHLDGFDLQFSCYCSFNISHVWCLRFSQSQTELLC